MVAGSSGGFSLRRGGGRGLRSSFSRADPSRARGSRRDHENPQLRIVAISAPQVPTLYLGSSAHNLTGLGFPLLAGKSKDFQERLGKRSSSYVQVYSLPLLARDRIVECILRQRLAVSGPVIHAVQAEVSIEIAPLHHHELPDLPPIFEEVVILVLSIVNIPAKVRRIVMAAVVPGKFSDNR